MITFDDFKEPRPKGRIINAPLGGSGCSLTEKNGLRPFLILCGHSPACGGITAASVKKIELRVARVVEVGSSFFTQ